MKKGKTMNESEKKYIQPNHYFGHATWKANFWFQTPSTPSQPLLGYFGRSTMPRHIYTWARSQAHTHQRVSFISIIIFLWQENKLSCCEKRRLKLFFFTRVCYLRYIFLSFSFFVASFFAKWNEREIR